MHIQSYDRQSIFYKILEPHLKNEPVFDVVFLHGLGGDSNALITLAKKTQEHIPNTKIILYDLRGHGLSTEKYPQNHDSFETIHTKDLQELLKALKIKNPILVGHCMGGMIAQEYATRELIPQPAQIITICSTPKLPNFFLFRQLWLKTLKKLSQNHKSAYKKRSVKTHLSCKNQSDFNLRRIWADIQSVGGFQRWLLAYGAVFGWTITKIEIIDKPKNLFILGKKDLILPLFLYLRQFNKLHKAKKMLINSNHISPLSNYEELAKIIAENMH